MRRLLQRRLLQRLLMRVYGADAEHEERRTKLSNERVLNRRRARLNIHAGVMAEAPSADDYAGWLGLDDPGERNR